MTKPHDVIQHWLDSINFEGRGLTPWEISFIEDVTAQWEETNRVSDRQEEIKIIERIYANKTPL